MAVLPRAGADKIAFCESHASPWLAQAVAIGTSPAAVADLTTKTTAARAAFNAQQAAQSAAMAATAAYQSALTAMARAAQTIVDQVRVKAATAGDDVYSLAMIPAPAAPSPMGSLGKPTGFKVSLDQRGVLDLTWKCRNPRGATGTVYQVWRRIGAAGEFEYLGGVGAKKFTDATVPAGSAQVQYQVQAVRSTGAGPVALFIVNFGADGVVPGVATAAELSPRRLAA